MNTERKKIVFHIINRLDIGGSENVAINIASSRNREFEYHVVEVARGRGQFSKDLLMDLKKKGLAIHRSVIPNKKLGIIFFPFWFPFLCSKYRPRVIHSHAEVPNLSLFLFHKFFGWMFRNTRYVRTIHNTVLWDEWEWIGKIVEPFYLHHHSNVAISKSVQESYHQPCGELPPIIYNGIDEVKQLPFGGLDESKINVLFAGRLEYQKGVDELMEVIKRCPSETNIVFWIVGSGSNYSKIEKSVLGLENVHYKDKIYGLSSYLASFDYLFMPSNFEGLGLLSIEASLAKVPTIINSCSGLQETLPEDWPLKVRDNNIDEYMKIFRRLNAFNKKELGMKAYIYCKEKFSTEEMQKQYESFYKSC